MKNKSNLVVQRIQSTCDITVSAIKHDQNICADLTGTHVDTSAEFLFDETLCALNDPCNTSYNNKQHLIQSVTCADFFTRISRLECLCYTMLNMPINIKQMLKKISNITSLSSLNTTHSFQFTFVLIGEYVVDNFHVYAICVTYNKLADLDSKMLRDKCWVF